MRPWLIAAGDFTTLGGMDRANHGLAAYLASNGRTVHVVAHRVSADLRSRPRVIVHAVPRPMGAHLLGAPLLAHEAVRQARALGSSACVLANGGNTLLERSTWVHYLHAGYSPMVVDSVRTTISSRIGRRYYLSRERAALRTAALVICNSTRTADDVRRHYGVPAARIHVVYYGVDTAQFDMPSAAERRAARNALGLVWERKVAVFIGALGDRRKGFDVLFDAWSILASNSAWDVDLLVAGTGGEQSAWVSRARHAGLDSHIRFLGFRSDIRAVLAASDVLVHPARYEPYGLGVHEALCRGLPAIVTEVVGIAERYPPELRGLIVPGSPRVESLVSALRAWHAAANEWREPVARLASQLRTRSWDDMAAEIVSVVES